MNPAIKRFIEYTLLNGHTPYIIDDGLEGLIDGKIKNISYTFASGLISRGGTVIGTSRSPRFFDFTFRKQAYSHLVSYHIDALIVLGGDGSFQALQQFSSEFPLLYALIPATIDNDFPGSMYALGVDTALNEIRHALDAIRDTGGSYHRAFVVETMGRSSGYLAAVSALTSGAEMCLIPEIPFDLQYLKKKFLQQKEAGRRYFLAVVAEGCHNSSDLKQWFEKEITVECRLTILGHIQRGGNPTVYDRRIAYDWMTQACDALFTGKSGFATVMDGCGHTQLLPFNESIRRGTQHDIFQLITPLCGVDSSTIKG